MNHAADTEQQNSQQSHEQSADREQTFSQLVNQPVSESNESLSLSEVWIHEVSHLHANIW